MTDTPQTPRLLACGLCFEEQGEEVHPHPECPVGRTPAVSSVSAVDQTTRDRIADRGTKAEALLLHFTAEAHRRKWNYDRGLDDDGQPIRSEAFGALHRLGDEMNAALHKLRATPAAVLPPPADRADDVPAAECSAQHRNFDDGRLCIRAAQHRGDHIDERGFHWSDTVAVYPLANGTFRTGVNVQASLRRLAAEVQQPAAGARQPDTETPDLPYTHTDDDSDRLTIGAVMATTYDGEAPVVAVAAEQYDGDDRATVYVRPERVDQIIAALQAARKAAEALTSASSAVPGRSAATSTDEEQARG